MGALANPSTRHHRPAHGSFHRNLCSPRSQACNVAGGLAHCPACGSTRGRRDGTAAGALRDPPRRSRSPPAAGPRAALPRASRHGSVDGSSPQALTLDVGQAPGGLGEVSRKVPRHGRSKWHNWPELATSRLSARSRCWHGRGRELTPHGSSWQQDGALRWW